MGKGGIILLGVSNVMWAWLYGIRVGQNSFWSTAAIAAMYLSWTAELVLTCKCGEEKKPQKPNVPG